MTAREYRVGADLNPRGSPVAENEVFDDNGVVLFEAPAATDVEYATAWTDNATTLGHE